MVFKRTQKKIVMARYSHKRHDTIRYDITQNIAIRYDTIRSRRDDGRRRRFGDRRLAFNLRSQATRRSSSLAPSTVVTSSLHPSACAATCAVCLVHSSGRVRANNALTNNVRTACCQLQTTAISSPLPPFLLHPLAPLKLDTGQPPTSRAAPLDSAGVS